MNVEQKFDILLERVYQSGLEDTGWQYFLRSYCAVFPHSKSSIATIDKGAKSKKIHAVGNYDPGALEEYNSYFASKNPFTFDKFGRNPSNIYWGTDIITKEDLFETEFYRGFLQKHENAWLGFGVCMHEGPLGKIYISNNTSDKYSEDFSEQFSIIRRLLPHMNRASEFHNRLSKYKSADDTFQNLIDRLNSAVFIIDEKAMLEKHNRIAETLLLEHSVVTVDISGIVRFVDDSNADIFRRQLSAAMHRSAVPDPGLYFRLESKDGKVFVAFLFPLYFAHGERDINIRSHLPRQFALFITDPQRRIHVDVEHLVDALAISHAEAALALALTNGMSVVEYSDMKGISQHTARVQLKSLMNKTNCARQSMLTAKIARAFGFARR